MKLIGGQIIAAEFGQCPGQGFAAINPATGAEIPPRFTEATQNDVDKAAASASAAFESYRQLPLQQRADFLEGIATELLASGPALVRRAHEESALPQARLEGELARTVNQLKLFAEQVRRGSFLDLRIDRAIPQRVPLPKPDLRTMQVPLGPVAVFGASNFPLAFSVAGGDTASALAAGCPVIVKGHPAHPGTSELAGQAIVAAQRKHKVPAGVFSLLQASSNTVGAALVQQPCIKAVAFTGSLTGGRALFDLACSRPEPIPVYAEMGSVNPLFILPQIMQENADSLAAALITSVTLGVGQFCTAPGLIMLLKGVSTEKFIGLMQGCLAQQAPGVMLTDGIRQNFLADLGKIAQIEGVRLLGSNELLQEGRLVAPVLFQTDAQTLLDNSLLTEEMFGPAAVIVLCDSPSEMMAVAAKLPGQLTATVHGTSQELGDFRDLLNRLELKAGRMIVNGFPTGVEVCDAMHHGGPFPATTSSASTSVGSAAVRRFLRPVCYQNCPQELLPQPLRDRNEEQRWRLVDGLMSRDDLS